MKFTSIILVALAAFATAAPVTTSIAARNNDISALATRAADLAAELDALLARDGLSAADELEARGLLSDLFGSSKASTLKVTFTDPSGSVSAARQKAATKQLTKVISAAQQKQFPFCSVDFGNGGIATFRCFSSASKKIGTQGPAGAINVG
ncbi:hypothetical protein HMN09_01113400 [Mycena chlorophos]|uniref:Uncharacterized protein n=1 Tax=Mycena chlorophos TaxID=658473 RepID=A0A8H6SCY5_MYCCL|nr:hypothetical protein HMN09_01113400 [Mycena chlorophos]